MNDECGCLLSFHAHFWCWPLLFHVRESWLPQRGVRRAYHWLFLCKCHSIFVYLCVCLALYIYLPPVPVTRPKYLLKNQPKLSFLQNFEIWFYKTFYLPLNLSLSQFKLLVSLNYWTSLSFLPFSVPGSGARSLFLVPRPYMWSYVYNQSHNKQSDIKQVTFGAMGDNF